MAKTLDEITAAFIRESRLQQTAKRPLRQVHITKKGIRVIIDHSLVGSRFQVWIENGGPSECPDSKRQIDDYQGARLLASDGKGSKAVPALSNRNGWKAAIRPSASGMGREPPLRG